MSYNYADWGVRGLGLRYVCRKLRFVLQSDIQCVFAHALLMETELQFLSARKYPVLAAIRVRSLQRLSQERSISRSTVGRTGIIVDGAKNY